jgi:hypothetical protein
MNGQIEIGREDQLARYRTFQFERGINVYIFIGVGGTPKAPRETFLIPLSRVLSPVVKFGYLKGFRKDIRDNFFFDKDFHLLT